ncbi:hypothetical protein [Paraburkholderia sp.]|jgi:hypothetical protein|uniref:hypothetical protein n=1 Tax=Paraburkholderia sp. TaxID=1926495 RepID=UPI002F3E4FAF
MRVASALGVSAATSGLPAAAVDATGALQLIVSPTLAFAVAFALTLTELLVMPPELAAFEPVPAGLLALLALPLEPSLDPPPPPQPARASNKEDSNND